jgi:hypothetical protein
MSCCARRTGSPEYIGIRQPVLVASIAAAHTIKIALLIA